MNNESPAAVSSRQRSFLGAWPAAKLVALWLIILAIPTAYGFSCPKDAFTMRLAVQRAVLLGGLGIGIATCISVGLWILAGVQTGLWRKGTAMIHLVTSSFVSVVSTPVAIILARPLIPGDALRGESALAIVAMCGEAAIAVGTVFVILICLVLLMRQNISAPEK